MSNQGKRGLNSAYMRATLQMSKEQAQETWQSLEKSIFLIFDFQNSKLSFEELYRKAYDLVIQKHGDLLYKGLSETIRQRCLVISAMILSEAQISLFPVLNKSWTDFKYAMNMIKDILMYMDRNYVKSKNTIPAYELGLNIFKQEILYSPNIKTKISELLIQSIQNERNGEFIEKELIRSIAFMLVEVGIGTKNVYIELFEDSFLDETKRFYEKEAEDAIIKLSCPEFLGQAEKRLKEEKARVDSYLDPSTEERLLQIVDHSFIEKHSKTLIYMENSGCQKMIEQMKIDDLKRMFKLYLRVPSCLRHISDCMSAFIQSEGSLIIASSEYKKNPVELVGALLKLRDMFNTIVTQAFDRDSMMETVMKISFENCINANSRTAHALALYVDKLLKKDIKGMREENIDIQLDQIIILFRYISDKDVFENFYKQLLAKRLLQSRSLSDDAEKLFITKLKTECGSHFTSKIEGMFTDMRFSSESVEDFQTNGDMEIEPSVLTAAYWPSDVVLPISLPREVIHEAERFRKYYLGRHSGRRLSWKTNMGTAEIRAILGINSSRHELFVSTYQMSALLLYNDRESLVYEEITQVLNCSDPDFEKHMLGLVKAGILAKSTAGKEVSMSTEFFLNPEFKSKLYRVKVPVLAKKDNEISTQSEVPEIVEDDRKHMIEATIVKIMKTRRKIDHAGLLGEVTKLISWRFVPSPKQIKSRIENLIEREYIQRDAENPNFYNYVA
ncbi:unnamed protein product [Blepharisma stoltei]|uniref:Cullin family profile domain-containing protein n=1 Tax=Blepharisma stoltei TaxID=1481888 RepID=A0AAU9KE36_9CILI|nr:unnamed protein product [Blepharisma stoltei]